MNLLTEWFKEIYYFSRSVTQGCLILLNDKPKFILAIKFLLSAFVIVSIFELILLDCTFATMVSLHYDSYSHTHILTYIIIYTY